MGTLRIVNTFRYDHTASYPNTTLNVPSPPKLVHDFGFDRSAKFTMIYVGGRAQFSVEGGNPSGMRFEFRPTTAFCKILSQDISLKIQEKVGLITIEGIAPGACKLSLVDAKGTTVDEISIDVVPFRSVLTRFYNLIDGKGRRAMRDPGTDPSVSQTTLIDLVFEINSIITPQCGVMMGLSGQGLIRDLGVLADLGNRVDINKHLISLVASSDFDRLSQYHIVFVWGIDGGHSRGITHTNVTLIQSNLGSARSITLAHEFAHFLSGSGIITVGDHDSDISDLLFKQFPHGIAMRQARLKKIIH